MDLAAFHLRLATTVLLYFLALSIWGFIRFFLKRGVDSNYWGALVIGEVVALVQGLIGIILSASGGVPGQPIHILYGVLTALGIPAAFAFTRGRDSRREMLIYGAVLLFMVGIAFRAMDTGAALGV
jgi:hypothetical protein